MSYFKRFTVFCAGFSAVSAWIYFFIQFMAYNPSEDCPLTEKLSLFLRGNSLRNYSMYLTLGFCFALSFALALLFQKLPSISFTASLLPMLYTMHQLDANQLYEHAMMYVVLAILHTAGELAECVRQDKLHHKHQGAFAAFLIPILTASVPLYIQQTIGKVMGLTDAKTLSYFKKVIFYSMPKNADLSVFRKIAILYVAVALLILLFREIHFLNTVFALVPFGYVLYLWHTSSIPVHGALVITAATVCVFTQLFLAISHVPLQAQKPR